MEDSYDINTSVLRFNNENNSTTGMKHLVAHRDHSVLLIAVVGTLLTLLVLCTSIGNSFVIAAVWKNKSLQTLTNKLVASLAVTDLLVGLVVMPLAAAYSLMGHWPFGVVVCHLFITADVLLCTSSILHLVAIAVDRLWAITDITYNRGSKLHKYMVPVLITSCWVLSAAICLPPFFGWKSEQLPGDCMISQDRNYTVYSTVLAFYLPLVVIIGIYIKIFFVVRARVRRKPFLKRGLHSPTRKNEVSTSHTMVTIITEESLADDIQLSADGHSSSLEQNNSSDENVEHEKLKEVHTLAIPAKSGHHRRSSVQQVLNHIPLLSHKKKNERSKEDKLALKRERKAFRTLAIITGSFVTCWLPFFIVALAYPFTCENPNKGCTIPKTVVNFVTWLGYVNCMLNPIIYNIFNPDFRAAFKKILMRRCK